MKIYQSIAELPSPVPSVISVGTFDGFHLGHQSILEKMKALARADQLTTTLVTFEPHPRKVLTGQPVSILTTLREKLQIFEELGIDQTLVIGFTREFAAKTSREFVADVLVRRLGVRDIVIGHDHHFGRNREGSYENLALLGREFGFTPHQVAPMKKNGEVVSSTRIRELVKSGEVEKAAVFLGRHYRIHATVQSGSGRGRELGFPTANLAVDDPDKLLPARGVYAVDVIYSGQTYKGMMNIGMRPTFEYDHLTLEVHLFNFIGLLYNELLEVRFKNFIREEKKFSSVQELKEQLFRDQKICEQM